jgi:hypothetical protein
MSKSLLFVLLILMAGLNIFLLFKITSSPANVQTASSENNREGAGNIEYVRQLRGRILLQAEYGPVELDPEALVMDSAGKESKLKDIIKSGEALVFFFTSEHCYSCIDGAIPRLENLAKWIGNDKIILLGQMKEKRDILAFKSRYKSNLPIFSISDSAVRSKAKSLNHPFLFLTNKKLQTRNPFFIESNLPEVTDDYLKEIRHHFSNI